MVPLEAKGADPDLTDEVDSGVGVEYDGAALASERRVRESGDIRVRPDRGDAGREWDHALAGFDLGARPCIPGHTNSVDALGICVRHFRHLRIRISKLNFKGFLIEFGDIWGFWGIGKERKDFDYVFSFSF